MQNGATVSRGLRVAGLAKHSGALPTESLIRDLLYRFEVWTVLECHAVQLAALSAIRDLRHARAISTGLERIMAVPGSPDWNWLEVELHRAIDDQSGNQVLAAMAERTHREVQEASERYSRGPMRTPEALSRIQSQHHTILSCIEAGQVDAAVQHTRAHLNFLRDATVDRLKGEIAQFSFVT